MWVMILMTFGAIFFIASFFLSKKEILEESKDSMSFECGIDSWGGSNSYISMRFYFICILFLLFEFEMIVIMPYITKSYFMLVNYDMLLKNVLSFFLWFIGSSIIFEWILMSFFWK